MPFSVIKKNKVYKCYLTPRPCCSWRCWASGCPAWASWAAAVPPRWCCEWSWRGPPASPCPWTLPGRGGRSPSGSPAKKSSFPGRLCFLSKIVVFYKLNLYIHSLKQLVYNFLPWMYVISFKCYFPESSLYWNIWKINLILWSCWFYAVSTVAVQVCGLVFFGPLNPGPVCNFWNVRVRIWI